MEAKKKNKQFIIPSSYFKQVADKLFSQQPKERIQQKQVETPPQVEKISIDKPKTPPVEVSKPADASVATRRRRNSGLSLKSLQVETVASTKKEDVSIMEDVSTMPKTEFSDAELQHFWRLYVEQLMKRGEKIIASIINADTPTVENSLIKITLPNDMMKAEMLRHRPKLLAFLKEKLNNYHIDLDVNVNEQVVKKFAYTPLEKYKKLREKNSVLDLLRTKFDLDL